MKLFAALDGAGDKLILKMSTFSEDRFTRYVAQNPKLVTIEYDSDNFAHREKFGPLGEWLRHLAFQDSVRAEKHPSGTLFVSDHVVPDQIVL